MELKQIILWVSVLIIQVVIYKLISMQHWYDKFNMYLVMFIYSLPLISLLIVKIII